MLFYIRKKYKLRQKLLLFVLTVLNVICICSCGDGGADPLSYRLSPFTAELHGQTVPRVGEAVEFSATVSFGEYTESGERELSLVFHSPESLDGLCFRRCSDGSVTVKLGEVECRIGSSDAIVGITKIAGMLEGEGDILGISSIPGRDEGLPQYERLTLVEMDSYVILIDPRTESPVKARSSDGEIEICFDTVTSGR